MPAVGTAEQVYRWWQGHEAARRSYPKHRGRWPDEDTPAILARLCTGYVVEIGCGTGRCSDAFAPERYLGLDINGQAIAVARRECPRHWFEVIGWDDPYPPADSYLFHTCLMHVPDGEVELLLRRCLSASPTGRVVIAEAMVPAYNKPPYYLHRAKERYEEFLLAAGYELAAFEEYDTNYQVNPSKAKLMRRYIVGMPA